MQMDNSHRKRSIPSISMDNREEDQSEISDTAQDLVKQLNSIPPSRDDVSDLQCEGNKIEEGKKPLLQVVSDTNLTQLRFQQKASGGESASNRDTVKLKSTRSETNLLALKNQPDALSPISDKPETSSHDKSGDISNLSQSPINAIGKEEGAQSTAGIS